MSQSAGYGVRTWPALVILVLAVAAPTAFLLWFVNAAVQGERFAVRQRLADVYGERALSASRALEEYWSAKAKALARDEAPAAAVYSRLADANVADSVVVFDASGRPSYPTLDMPPTRPAEETPRWSEALSLEYETSGPDEAAEAFGALALESTCSASAARALQAQARCLIEGGREAEAIAVFERLQEREFADAADEHGALIAPNALLAAATLAAKTDEAGAAGLAERLRERIDSYGEPVIAAPQRRFLMQAYTDAALPGPAVRGLDAETMAARYLAWAREAPTPGRLSPAGEGMYAYAAPGGNVVALFKSERLAAELAEAAGLGRAGEGAEIRLAAPDGRNDEEPFVSIPAPAAMPLWHIEVRLVGADPFSAAARRQTAAYLWTATAGILVFGAIALVAGRYVARQARLTRLKNDLIATVSHELKTPLASMRVLADTLVAGRVTSDAQAREYFALIAKENERLSRLVENFLTFSRMERGKRTFERESVDLADVVTTAAEPVRERFERPGCRLEIDAPQDLPTVVGDHDALVTVVVNLLENAYKYSGDEKVVRVRAYASEAREGGGARAACISVSDNGIGIARRDRRRIFDRFYQADRSLSRTAGGCGLGLAIVKFIIDAHGGTVEVASEPGRGSEFTVRLPA